MSDKNTLGLSRRRLLGGLGAIGVASAGAGLGTSAYFSDTESFVGNILQAGQLDLYVHVDYEEYQQTGDTPTYTIDTILQGDTEGEDPNGDPLHIDVSDLKPGDHGEGELCFSIVDNPAYLWMCGELTANNENTVTEPEADADGENNDYSESAIEGMGELADAMQVTLSYCSEAEEDDGGLEIGETIIEGSLAEVMSQLDNGVPLDGDPDTADTRDPFPGSESSDETAEQCVCLEWEVPMTVGNEIQTDSVEFDFSFAAVQARHNDGSVNPCINGTVVEGFGKFSYWDDPANFVNPWFGKVRNGASGGTGAWELLVGNTNSDADNANFDYGGSSYSGPLTVTYDAGAGEASLDFDGTTVTYDVNDDPGDVISVVARGSESDHYAAANDVQINGTTPSGDSSVEADGNEINSLNIESVDTGTDWTLTADLEFEGLDPDPSASDENPAVYVEILDTP